MAAAGPHDHVSVFLQDDIGAVVEVEDGDGVELSRGAARLGHRVRVDEVDLEHTPNIGRGQTRALTSLWLPYVCKGQVRLGQMTSATPTEQAWSQSSLRGVGGWGDALGTVRCLIAPLGSKV